MLISMPLYSQEGTDHGKVALSKVDGPRVAEHNHHGHRSQSIKATSRKSTYHLLTKHTYLPNSRGYVSNAW